MMITSITKAQRSELMESAIITILVALVGFLRGFELSHLKTRIGIFGAGLAGTGGSGWRLLVILVHAPELRARSALAQVTGRLLYTGATGRKLWG